MKRIILIFLFFIFLENTCAESDESAVTVFEDNTAYYFQATGVAARVPTQLPYSCLQGGGTDGKYAYYAMTEQKLMSIIYKYDLETWECIAVSEPLKLAHANDIAYDPLHHRLLVASIELERVCYVDPDTLCDLGFDRTLLPVHRLEYVPQTNQLLIGSHYWLLLFPGITYQGADLRFECQGNRYVTQGLTCDGHYIYDVRWDAEQYEASLSDTSIVCDYIVVHDLHGNFIGDFPVYGLEGEPENMICLGKNRFAIGCNGSDSIYLVELRK